MRFNAQDKEALRILGFTIALNRDADVATLEGEMKIVIIRAHLARRRRDHRDCTKRPRTSDTDQKARLASAITPLTNPSRTLAQIPPTITACRGPYPLDPARKTPPFLGKLALC